MKKLIFGSGKVANVLLDKNSIIVPKKQCDIANKNDVLQIVKEHAPDVVINCAAITNLERCQDNMYRSYEVNTVGVINLLLASEAVNSKFVHISSGCLFDGNESPMDEGATPDPKVWYTRTKTWADEFITNYDYEDYLILRPRQLISKKPHPTNVLTKFSLMSEIHAIKEINSITCVEDFAEMINHLLDKNATGIYNCANEGTVTPHQIALGVKKYLSPNLQVYETSYEKFLETLKNRRVNTVLSLEKIKATGYTPRLASEALEWCLREYGDEK